MYIVSACLAGINCRYDGKNNLDKRILKLVKKGKAILVCPEQLGGLTTPRDPSEIIVENGIMKVKSINNKDVTENFERGAMEVLKLAKEIGANKAILKSRSPSCGCGVIYDGTFSGKLIQGNGVTAKMLIENGIKVLTEEDLNDGNEGEL